MAVCGRKRHWLTATVRAALALAMDRFPLRSETIHTKEQLAVIGAVAMASGWQKQKKAGFPESSARGGTFQPGAVQQSGLSPGAAAGAFLSLIQEKVS